MHQSVVEYDVAPAAMSAATAVTARRPALRQTLRSSDAAAPSPLLASDPWPRRGVGGLSSYLAAAGIAAGLVATWVGLCII